MKAKLFWVFLGFISLFTPLQVYELLGSSLAHAAAPDLLQKPNDVTGVCPLDVYEVRDQALSQIEVVLVHIAEYRRLKDELEALEKEYSECLQSVETIEDIIKVNNLSEAIDELEDSVEDAEQAVVVERNKLESMLWRLRRYAQRNSACIPLYNSVLKRLGRERAIGLPWWATDMFN